MASSGSWESTQQHYIASIAGDADISPLWKDVFTFHWREEVQHAILDELEWQREDAKLSASERDQAVNDLIALVAAVDGILQAQARADAEYFIAASGRKFTPAEVERLHAGVRKAYRWQYIVSGVQDKRFNELLGAMITPEQSWRIGAALEPILH
jgi:hypothetical protein